MIEFIKQYSTYLIIFVVFGTFYLHSYIKKRLVKYPNLNGLGKELGGIFSNILANIFIVISIIAAITVCIIIILMIKLFVFDSFF